MVVRLARWNRGAAFAAIRTDWLARAAGLGRTIHIALDDSNLSGRFETIDDTGRLMLRTSDGKLRPIAAGDVVGAGR
jgi:BirA family transcriptional regulator, biotin operon repressor / biotin---[acetyl-CoA-carboxylase] ligase